MAKDKYDFIQDLLTNKRLTPSQKERVLLLTKIEIEKDRNLGKDLNKRVDELEKSVRTITRISDNLSHTIPNSSLPIVDPKEEIKSKKKIDIKNNYNTTNTSNLPIYIEPEKLYRALLAFNQNTILKTICHTIDNDMIDLISKSNGKYEFDFHLDLIKNEFTKISKEFSLTQSMYALINQYIYGELPWSTQKITMSWSNSILKDWANKNPGIYPNPSDSFIEEYENEGFKLPESFISDITGNNIIFFNDFVLFFKSLWHIKSENSLKKLVIKRGIDYKFNDWADVEISKNFSSTINLYTDVDKLLQAYSKIINLIKTVNKENGINEKPYIILSFYEDKNEITFSIHHKNAIWLKSIQSTIEKPFGNSMKSIITNQINGLCDLYVGADFGDSNFAEINLWNGEKPIDTEVPKDFDGGVEYLLKFKR
ncbi:hypothetical protein [Kaistella sp.]|uniref:hypothetical protein n=1 Tax=Kaistella sp. TaxID=2782235 RepID=UPI0035A123B8